MADESFLSRRRVLGGLGAAAFGAAGGWWFSSKATQPNHVDMTAVPEGWLDEGRVRVKFEDGWYWLDMDEKTFEPAEVEG